MTFVEQLQYIMNAEGLTQRTVSVKSGISEATISCYMHGTRIPNVDTANLIFKSLGYEAGIPYKESKKESSEDLRKNGSGVKDMVAYNAIRKADKDRERLMKLLDVIFTICDYAGFHVEERIVLKDKKTGKIWR